MQDLGAAERILVLLDKMLERVVADVVPEAGTIEHRILGKAFQPSGKIGVIERDRVAGIELADLLAVLPATGKGSHDFPPNRLAPAVSPIVKPRSRLTRAAARPRSNRSP